MRHVLTRARRAPRAVVLSVVLLALSLGLPIAFVRTQASAATNTSCEKFAVIPVANGAYNVQTNEWNSDATHCVGTDGTAGFAVTQSAVNVPTAGPPGSYPSIYRGCHWGACTAGSGLPIQVSKLGHATTSWSTTQTGTGAYDVAYDVWFDQSPSTSGQPNGAELMIWLNRNGGVQPAGSLVGTTTVSGHTWEVWRAQMPGWTYVAYVLQGGAAAVSNLDLGDVTRDSVNRGYINPSWYLITVEAGFEHPVGRDTVVRLPGRLVRVEPAAAPPHVLAMTTGRRVPVVRPMIP